MAFECNFDAFRHATWGGEDSLDYLVCVSEDLSQAQFAWSFATAPGGEVRIRLENAEPGAQGVHARYEADMVDPVTGKTVGGSYLIAQIDASTLKALPIAPGETDDVVLYHTLYVTQPGSPKRAECFGSLTIKQGAPD
ncbi:hypothetical protein GR702_18755 [Novosphingobium sp. FGD1]|uniref:Uncharacterized protein n=1 Tax=Novosphingobium silvae TaxID=2692619 RepID=A0A7X4K9W2_9SPHN|nr:hypothetical protein [Novosphingobium silvae]MYL99803.1 hypothetical protein [Novosphingobium silvae]